MMGRHFMVNKAFAEFVGLGEAQIIDKTDEQIFPPELAERFASSDREVIKNGKAICIKEEIAYKNRGTLFFETVKSPLYDEQGERVGVIGVTRDTTDHRTAERESQLFKSLINRLNDAIFVVDPETSRFLDVNDKACSSLGYIRDEFLRMKVIDIEAVFPETSFWERHVKEVKKQGYMVLAAAESIDKGSSKEEAIAAALNIRDRSYMFAALSTLKYLAMSGRVGHIAAGFANLLDVKPILTIRNGKLDLLEKIRTQKKAWSHTIELISNASQGKIIERISVIHVNVPEKAEYFKELLKSSVACPDLIETREINPGLSVHSGAGMVGAVVVTAD